MTTTHQERPQAPKGRELARIIRRSGGHGEQPSRPAKRRQARTTERRQAIREQTEIWA